jgi:hypothetical protein
MSITPSSPITGQPQTGLTSPTYTTVTDTAPTPQGKQVVVTALGGTQVGVTIHSVASPFTLNYTRPANLRVLGQPSPVNNVITNVPINTYGLLTRKGVLPLTGQAIRVMEIRTTIGVPAGADTADAPNVRAALSCHLGYLVQQSAGFGDMAINGVL